MTKAVLEELKNDIMAFEFMKSNMVKKGNDTKDDWLLELALSLEIRIRNLKFLLTELKEEREEEIGGKNDTI